MKLIGALIGAGITRARGKAAKKLGRFSNVKPTYRRAMQDTSGYNPRTGRMNPARDPYNPQRKVRPKLCKGQSPGTDSWYEFGCD